LLLFKHIFHVNIQFCFGGAALKKLAYGLALTDVEGGCCKLGLGFLKLYTVCFPYVLVTNASAGMGGT
jgi:hypothetical protein